MRCTVQTIADVASSAATCFTPVPLQTVVHAVVEGFVCAFHILWKEMARISEAGTGERDLM